VIRTMESADEPAVRAIFAECYPDRPAQPAFWFVANPTLVYDERRTILGYTQFMVDNNNLMIFRDVALSAAARGKGIGRKLHDERMMIGRSLGCTTFIGQTAEDNLPMIRIFEQTGFHACKRAPDNRIIYVNAGVLDVA
jgi:GNAT superfamily N-acetyltransferase